MPVYPAEGKECSAKEVKPEALQVFHKIYQSELFNRECNGQ
jgi:hypothetical protein